jgi:hypothetical protein
MILIGIVFVSFNFLEEMAIEAGGQVLLFDVY